MVSEGFKGGLIILNNGSLAQFRKLTFWVFILGGGETQLQSMKESSSRVK